MNEQTIKSTTPTFRAMKGRHLIVSTDYGEVTLACDRIGGWKAGDDLSGLAPYVDGEICQVEERTGEFTIWC